MDTSAVTLDNLIAYCESLAGEFLNRRNRVRSFVQHNLTSGTANEAILRDFLSDISSSIFKVAQGFLCNPMRSISSRQCDILIYDQRFPLVHNEGDVKIVWPESALMVVEVKTTMRSIDVLKDAVANIVSAKATEPTRRLCGLVFSFQSLEPSTVLEFLKAYPCDPLHRPLAVVLMDKGAIIHQSETRDWRYGGGSSDYALRMCVGEDSSALALTYLLLIFLQIQMHYSPGFSSSTDLEMAIAKFFEKKTTFSEAET